MTQFFLDKFLFLSELFANPRVTGSVIPSSKYLANSIVKYIPKLGNGYIVELGAGTGAITKEIIAAGIDPKRLIIIEISPRLVKVLREHYPNVTIIEGNAEHLDLLLREKASNIDAIVSSLPLKSLPKNVVENIVEKIKHVLLHKGVYIQYTYMILKKENANYKDFHLIHSQIVWKNIPPAQVSVLEMKSPQDRVTAK